MARKEATLYHKTGDCEDTAILFASVLEAKHFDVVLIIYHEQVAAGVDLPGVSGPYFELDGSHYLFCETTGTSWDVGEVPNDVSVVAQDVVQVP